MIDSKENTMFSPKDCISRKMMKCHRITAGIFRKHLLPFNITNSQLSILFVTSKHQRLTQSILSEKLSLEKSSMSRNIRRLIESRFLAKDGQKIYLTQKGKVLLKKVIPHWQNAMQEIRAILEEDGEVALNSILSKLSRAKS